MDNHFPYLAKQLIEIQEGAPPVSLLILEIFILRPRPFLNKYQKYKILIFN